MARRICCVAALCLALVPGLDRQAAGSVGLGNLAIRSELGERFWAELEIMDAFPADELAISFGAEEDYRARGLELKDVVRDIIPLLSAEDARRVYLYSLHEIHEASFDLLVKLRTAKGAVSRAYHIQLAEEKAAPEIAGVPEEGGAPVRTPVGEEPAPRERRHHPYVVHVASFRDSAVAGAQVKELRAGTIDAFMVLTRIRKNELFYRVLVGRYATYREAAECASQLKETAHVSYAAPLKLPYSVGISAENEQTLLRRGYRLRLVPGYRLEENPPVLALGAYSNYEEAAALSTALTENGVPASVLEP